MKTILQSSKGDSSFHVIEQQTILTVFKVNLGVTPALIS